MKIGENEYKLILIDTNALREIVTNENSSGKGFLNKFFGEEKYAPCFSIYNVFELKPYQDIYEKFIDFFSVIPCLMFYPYTIIISEEVKAFKNKTVLEINEQIARAFSPLGNANTHGFRNFFESMYQDIGLVGDIENEINELKPTAVSWENQRKKSQKLLMKAGCPLNMIDENYYRSVEKQTIIKDLLNFDKEIDNNANIEQFPSIRIMEYSQFNRVYCTKKSITPNDVMDIKICTIVPYLDAVITENFQANVYRKAKKIIPQMKGLELYTLKDIRANC